MHRAIEKSIHRMSAVEWFQLYVRRNKSLNGRLKLSFKGQKSEEDRAEGGVTKKAISRIVLRTSRESV
jgi:hypothetical protein